MTRRHSRAGVALLALSSLTALILSPGSPRAVQKSEAEVQLEFGAKMARKGAWREAAFRFEKSIKADPTNPRAYNNLAVALENLGRYDEALKAYEKALGLAPEDQRIRTNYDRFASFYRARRRTGDES